MSVTLINLYCCSDEKSIELNIKCKFESSVVDLISSVKVEKEEWRNDSNTRSCDKTAARKAKGARLRRGV